MKKPEFTKLMKEYMDEISDPKNREEQGMFPQASPSHRESLITVVMSARSASVVVKRPASTMGRLSFDPRVHLLR